MKKFLAILLALLLVMVNVAALATDLDTDTDTDQNPEANQSQDIPAINAVPVLRQQRSGSEEPHFVKKYDTNKEGVVPTEILTFDVSVPAGVTNPDGTTITVGNNNQVAVSTAKTTVPVNVPENFTKPGKYSYIVKETAGTSQGTDTYDETEIKVDVYVVYKDGALTVLGTNVYTTIEGEGDNASKKDEITNVYEVGDLTVAKAIDGNLADANMEFTMEVTFTTDNGKTVNSDITISGTGTAKASEAGDAITSIGKSWTGDKKIYVVTKGGENVKFENIPAGVSYSIKETKAGTEEISRIAIDNTTQLANANNPAAYTVTGDEEGAGVTGTIAKDSADTKTITNYKGVKIPTGIVLDTLPYVLILAVAAFGLVTMAARKRKEY